ncbi:MAG: hypothetical protein A3I76_05105 [Elusimicrobia bacterium RIFCSPLOWO2_02_FULL_61_11]|nr:MAG: hypothetical protein A3I76_05105 [Elusimicrobia bacterium RIFCSPLOWO2_02_FULL_61_11]
MKKTLFAAIILGLSGGAYAENFSALAVGAPSLKLQAEARPLSITPELSEIFSSAEKADTKWYGADSRQARMQFTTYLLYKVPASFTGPVDQLLSNSYHRQKISELVDLQLQHMYGAFTMHPGFTEAPGIPSGDYKVTLLGAEKGPAGYARINYSYDDIVVFSKNLFQGGGAVRIDFVLPKDPVTVYSKGFPSSSSRKNYCTDDHYNSEGDFWYFWNPYQDGCPLDGKDLVGVTTDLRPMPVTRGTYPEYAKLYGENGNGDVLQVTYLVGVDENFKNGDLGKRTFLDAFAGLKAAGFQTTVDEPRRKRLSFRFGTKRASIEMRLMDPGSAEFAQEAVRGMKTADIFLYDGHSGLGGYLSPDRLAEDTGRPVELPKNKYQIFVFQGCSTYAYYNSAYFKLKRSGSDPKGTKNLDIITTGIGAAFEVGAKVDVAFLTSVAAGQKPSWQTIIDRVHAAEGDNTALSHVNGDEDNPRSPN